MMNAKKQPKGHPSDKPRPPAPKPKQRPAQKGQVRHAKSRS
jgi:hypothetical protein